VGGGGYLAGNNEGSVSYFLFLSSDPHAYKNRGSQVVKGICSTLSGIVESDFLTVGGTFTDSDTGRDLKFKGNSSSLGPSNLP
jgi:hypothetical protein